MAKRNLRQELGARLAANRPSAAHRIRTRRGIVWWLAAFEFLMRGKTGKTEFVDHFGGLSVPLFFLD